MIMNINLSDALTEYLNYEDESSTATHENGEEFYDDEEVGFDFVYF